MNLDKGILAREIITILRLETRILHKTILLEVTSTTPTEVPGVLPVTVFNSPGVVPQVLYHFCRSTPTKVV